MLPNRIPKAQITSWTFFSDNSSTPVKQDSGENGVSCRHRGRAPGTLSVLSGWPQGSAKSQLQQRPSGPRERAVHAPSTMQPDGMNNVQPPRRSLDFKHFKSYNNL